MADDVSVAQATFPAPLLFKKAPLRFRNNMRNAFTTDMDAVIQVLGTFSTLC